MRDKRDHLSSQIREVLSDTRAYRAAAQRAGYVAVCLVGWDGPRPKAFGDNRGIWPVRVATSTKERDAAKDDDLSSPHVGCVVLERAYVKTPEHARRLKAALDNMLLGEMESQENGPLRHSWRDVNGCFETEDERHQWWAIVLNAALRDVGSGAREFVVFDGVERGKSIEARAKRGR